MTMRSAVEEAAQFRRLQARLVPLWRAIRHSPDFEHTSIVVPSQSVDQEELSKIDGAPYYEERLLFSLMRLRHPSARVIYLTSQPVHPDVVDYYLQMLHGMPGTLARRRLTMLCVWDGSAKPLTEKILERPLLLRRIQRLAGPPDRAYITCFNSTFRERRLSVALGIPLNGVDPDLLDLGSKSGSRQVFAAAGVPHPAGVENLKGKQDILDALAAMKRDRRGLHRAVIKLDHSFSGEGNAIYEYPPASDDDLSVAAIESQLGALRWSGPGTSLDRYLAKFGEMGGVIEEYLEGEGKCSPSVQMRIHPDRRLEVVSTHDQILGGPTGQVYLGCRFPAHDTFRMQLTEAAIRIGSVLGERGVIGRFGIDFVAILRGADWDCRAIEINLRMGGTTPPFLALQFLTGGRLDDEGHFISRSGKRKFYRATDHLKSSHYRGLMAEDLIEHTVRQGLRYDPSTETGVLFHMIGALSQYGKCGLTAIGGDPLEAEDLYERTVNILDDLTGATPGSRRHAPLLDRHWTGIE
jgi:hypothetical protein